MSAAVLLLSPARDRRRPLTREALVERISGEFHEMPCLRLTPSQAQRLFGLRADVCQRVLSALVADGTLTRDIDERYRLNDCSRWPVGRLAAKSREICL